MNRIAVAMSGGVDSSAAAALLHEAGHEVVGITLQLWDYSSENLAAGKGRCCSPADIADARAVAAQLGFPHYVFDHSDSFRREIVEPFLDAWSDGLTPSPCITCNRRLKFGLLWQLARCLGADRLATGHYARLSTGQGRPRLRRGRDPDKDQSYFLFDIAAEQLEGVSFPLGHLDKDEVRTAARRHRLKVADKPESYELCFIPDGDKNAFVERRRPETAAPGTICDESGAVLGTHPGVHRFTVGQRRGIGVTSQQPLYVLHIEPHRRAITVGAEDRLYSRHLRADRCNWVSIEPPTVPLRVEAGIRHRHAAAPATLTPLGGDRVELVFDEAQRAIAPGQGVAFYDGDLLLGGGWINRSAA